MVHSYKTSAAFVLGVVALDALSIGIVLPVLPSLVESVTHGSLAQASFYVGGLFGVYSLMQFLFSPIMGGLSDRFGRRAVLLLCLGALGVNALLWVWADSIGALFALRIAAGVFGANLATASAYIGDVTPPEKRSQYFGLIGAMFGIGFILGPILGGILGQTWIRLPFLVAALLILCNVTYGFFMLPESLPPEKRRPFVFARANPFGSLRAVGKTADDRRLIFVWCCLWLMVGAHQASFILSNQMRFGWNMMQNGLVLGFGGVFQALVMGALVPKAAKRWGEHRTAELGLVFCVVTYALFAFAVTPAVLFVGLLMMALSTLATPTMQAMLSIGAGEGHQGEIQGALISLQGLMLVIGPVSMSALFSLATRKGQSLHFAGAPFLAAAIVSVAALVVLRGVRRADPAAPAPGIAAQISDVQVS